MERNIWHSWDTCSFSSLPWDRIWLPKLSLDHIMVLGSDSYLCCLGLGPLPAICCQAPFPWFGPIPPFPLLPPFLSGEETILPEFSSLLSKLRMKIPTKICQPFQLPRNICNLFLALVWSHSFSSFLVVGWEGRYFILKQIMYASLSPFFFSVLHPNKSKRGWIRVTSSLNMLWKYQAKSGT